jgi:GntR family transcriptional regulator/MocR family aminotransferase
MMLANGSSPGRQYRELFLVVEGGSRISIRRQIELQIRDRVQRGLLRSGDRLPSSRVLAAELGISRGVIGRAYAQLAAEGYLLMRQGSAPRVADLNPTKTLQAPAPRSAARIKYDLRPGSDLSCFPRRSWLAALRHVLASAPDISLGHVDRAGAAILRREIAAYLGRVRGVDTSPENVVITAGSSHALATLARALHRSGERTIAVENPSPAVYHELVRRNGLAPVGIPVDGDGIAVGEVTRTDARAVVVAPAHQFPLGMTLASHRRVELIRWALDSGAIVIENDQHAEYSHDRSSEALQARAPENVVYLGSTSKSLAPGLRLGWAVLPSSLVDPFADELYSTTISLPGIEQLAFAEFLLSGEFERHVHRMRLAHRRRHTAIMRALREELPLMTIGDASGGTHVLIALPKGQLDVDAQAVALSFGVAVDVLSRHFLPRSQIRQGLLVGFGATSEPSIPTAIRALAKATSAG